MSQGKTKSKSKGRSFKTRHTSHKIPRMNPVLIGLCFVLGIVLHPFCIEKSELFLSPIQETFLLTTAVGLTLFLFLMSKNHFLCTLMQAGGLLWNTTVFIIKHIADGWDPLLKNMDYEWWFRILLMWGGGVLVTFIIRLFAHNKWNASHIRKTFSRGFLVSSIVFFLIYLALLLDLFVFQRTATEARRSLHLIPFRGAFATYWPQIKKGKFTNGVFVQFFGNLLIFSPLGFYLHILWGKRGNRWILYLIPVLLAGTIEACQYFFNIGECDIDDLWMNVVGFFVGILIVKIMDAIRKTVTKGKEKTIFKLS
ncbi:MAG: VanZ family protein [Clostridiales bacterium]|nr:VanZ family protein [Clostridiales bacterium]